MMVLRLAHLSDLHISPLPEFPLSALANKRLTGYLNWTLGKREKRHRLATLNGILDDIAEHRPDHIAVSGDLINLGLEDEFPRARAVLERIGPPDRVSFVPGNHDAYMAQTAPRILSDWGPFVLNAGHRTGFAEPPRVQRFGRVVLIGVDTAVPTLPFSARGCVGKVQRSWLASTLRHYRQEGFLRVVMMHHPPFPVSFQKRLADHAALCRVLEEEGAELVLHGHTHKGTVTSLPGPSKAIPVVGVPSASMSEGDDLAGWNLLTLHTGGGIMDVLLERRGIAHRHGRVQRVFARRL
jgi:3',5'-cyclic AMP phosphodiesterase CpdA